MKCHTQKDDDDASPLKTERRHTLSEGSEAQTQPPLSQAADSTNNLTRTHSGIPLNQILAPSNNYIGPLEDGSNSHHRHTSIDVVSNYIDPRTQQHRRPDLSGWTPPSPSHLMATNSTNTSNPGNPHRQSPSQRSADASTFETSMSGTGNAIQTPQSATVATQFGHVDMDWLSQGNLQGDFHDPFQMWLFPSLGDLDSSPDFLQTYDTGATPNFAIPDNHKYHPDPRTQDSVNRSKNISKVPRERFGRIQRCWAPRPHRIHRIMPKLWREVIASSLDNILAEDGDVDVQEKIASNWGLDAELRARLKDNFRTPAPTRHPSPRPGNGIDSTVASNMSDAAGFPPPEILDIALGLFFRRFHPTVPFIHVPTFCVRSVPPHLLFAMCLIGLSILGTTGALRFVSKMFSSFLDRVSDEMATCASGTAPPLQQVTVYATALLTLHLATMTGDKDSLAQCQMLYASLIAICQQNGLFFSGDGEDLDLLISELHESENQWKAWCRVESTKRLILSLSTLDAWNSSILSRSPIIRSELVSIIAPCSDYLFNAKSATQWHSLLRSGQSVVAPTLTIQDLHSAAFTSDLTHPLGYLGASSLLALLQIQILESYTRLMPSSHLQLGPLIPYQLYASDLKARSLKPAVLAAYATCCSSGNTNCTVLWHVLNMALLSDVRTFEHAAGKYGAAPATPALESISQWSQTVSARRACVHAAQTFRLMSERKVSENVTVHSVAALFTAALVLSLYLFMVSPSTNFEVRGRVVELVEAEVDWSELGSVGYEEDEESGIGLRQSGGPRGGLIGMDEECSPVKHFVKYGGTISLGGVSQEPGYESARRLLLDFANLMDGISGRRLRSWTQVLHIMSDDLMNVDPGN